MEHNLKGRKTWNKILKPADKVAAKFIGMAVGFKTRNPQSTHTTTNTLKTKLGGRITSLTDESVTVSVKSLCSFDSKKHTIKRVVLSKIYVSYDRVERCSKCGKFSQKSIFLKSSTSQYGLNVYCKTYRNPICTGNREKQLDQHKRFFDKNRAKEQD